VPRNEHGVHAVDDSWGERRECGEVERTEPQDLIHVGRSERNAQTVHPLEFSRRAESIEVVNEEGLGDITTRIHTRVTQQVEHHPMNRVEGRWV
jgi:hypothetical protein